MHSFLLYHIFLYKTRKFLTGFYHFLLHAFLATGAIEANSIQEFDFTGMNDVSVVKEKTIKKQKEIIFTYLSRMIEEENLTESDSILGIYDILDELHIDYTKSFINTFRRLKNYNIHDIIFCDDSTFA